MVKIVYTIGFAIILTVFGSLLTRFAYYHCSMEVCVCGIILALAVDISNILDALKINPTTEERRQELAVYALALRATFIAHIACALLFFLCIVKDLPANFPLLPNDELAWISLPGHIKLYYIVLLFPIARTVFQIYFVAKLIADKKYFLL